MQQAEFFHPEELEESFKIAANYFFLGNRRLGDSKVLLIHWRHNLVLTQAPVIRRQQVVPVCHILCEHNLMQVSAETRGSLYLHCTLFIHSNHNTNKVQSS